jgi:hypothetical protein
VLNCGEEGAIAHPYGDAVGAEKATLFTEAAAALVPASFTSIKVWYRTIYLKKSCQTP